MSARQELIDAVVSLRELGELRIDSMRTTGRPRESAVLILVGALDDIPAAASEVARASPRGVEAGAGPDSGLTTSPAAVDPLTAEVSGPSSGPSGAGMVRAEDLDVLLTQRAATLRSHPGQVAFPGGRLDPEDGDPFDDTGIIDLPAGPVNSAYVRAALREAQEETGLDPAGVEVLGALPRTPVPVSGHSVVPIVGWWSRPTEVDVVDHAESSLVFRVPILDLVDPAQRHTAEVRRSGPNYPVRRHRSPAFRVPRAITDASGGTDDVVVWGFTGILLDRVLTSAGWARPWDDSDIRPAPTG